MSSDREIASGLVDKVGDEQRMKIRVHVRIVLRKLIIQRIGKHRNGPGLTR